MSKLLHIEPLEDGRVLRLMLDNPKGNVLTGELMGELDRAFEAAAKDQHLKLVLIGAVGRNFSFGASVEEHRADSAADMLGGFHKLVRTLCSYPVPVAALVSGRCLGGALELVLCATEVFADKDAVFACPEIKLGVFPPVLAALGPGRIGAAWSERLVLTGREIDAATALRIDLVSHLCATKTGASLEDAALAWYREHLAPLSAFSLRQALAATRIGADTAARVGAALDRAETLYLETLLPSHDGNEGIEAFLARRPAVWKDA